MGGLASGAKGLMDVVKGATPGQVCFSAGKKVQEFHFYSADNHCGTGSCGLNLWGECEQGNCKASGSGSCHDFIIFDSSVILAPSGCGKGFVRDCYLSIWRGHHAVGYVPGTRQSKLSQREKIFI